MDMLPIPRRLEVVSLACCMMEGTRFSISILTCARLAKSCSFIALWISSATSGSVRQSHSVLLQGILFSFSGRGVGGYF